MKKKHACMRYAVITSSFFLSFFLIISSPPLAASFIACSGGRLIFFFRIFLFRGTAAVLYYALCYLSSMAEMDVPFIGEQEEKEEKEEYIFNYHG